MNHIQGNNDCDFGHLIASASDGNVNALSRLNFVLTVMLKTWAKRERQELRWMASCGKCVQHFFIVKTIIEKYLENFTQNKDNPSFVKFRDYALKEFSDHIRIGFMEFVELLRQKNQQAWKIIYEDLQNRSAAWFYKKNHSLNGEDHSVFTLSVEIFYSKFIDNGIFFSDSVEFKSYFFRILENKVLEALKDPYPKHSVPIDDAGIKVFVHPDTESSFSDDERGKILTTALNRLNHDENHILSEYYFGEKSLKEIAQETNQTEENVRIKKFRALKKLNVYFKKTGYGS